MFAPREIQEVRKPTARAFFLCVSIVLLIAATDLSPTASGASSDQEKLDAAESSIESGQNREQVLTSDIEDLTDKISALEGQVSGLRQQESGAEAELKAKQAELDAAIRELDLAVKRLKVQRQHLKRALINLRENLVSSYMAGPPDMAAIALASSDYGELIAASAYLEAIQNESESLAERVRELRNQAQSTVEIQRESKLTIEAARDEIAVREQQLETTRVSLESRQVSLASTNSAKENLLGSVRADIDHQEEIAAGLRAELESTIAAASSTATFLPSTPSEPGSSGMIWPVDGVLSSIFGPRWGSVHEGIDISAPGGTPIKAAASGTVILMQSEAESGGYGNYTCVDHGGGLASCYAHQSEFGTSSGASVSQGDIIGYVGNTGHSFGDHLHFEVRIDGVAQDPLGYL